MKRLRVVGLLLLVLHLGAAWGLKICVQGSETAHAHIHNDTHQHDNHAETEQPQSFHCADMPYLMAFNGKNARFPTDKGPVIVDTYDFFTSQMFAPKTSFSESSPPILTGLPPYLVFSVLRI